MTVDFLGLIITLSLNLNQDFPMFNKGHEAFDWCINLPFITIMKM